MGRPQKGRPILTCRSMQLQRMPLRLLKLALELRLLGLCGRTDLTLPAIRTLLRLVGTTKKETAVVTCKYHGSHPSHKVSSIIA